MMAAAAAMALNGAAGAQNQNQIMNGNSWHTSDNNWTGSFNGCASKGNGLVDCTFTETYVGPNNTKGGQWTPPGMIIVLNGGQEIRAKEITLAGERSSGTRFITTYQNMPIPSVWHFKLPGNLAVIPRLVYGKAIFSNVPVKGVAAAPAPVAPSNAGSTLPSTQAVIDGKAFTLNFANCRASGAGYVCSTQINPVR